MPHAILMRREMTKEAQPLKSISWPDRQKTMLFASSLLVVGLIWSIYDRAEPGHGTPGAHIIELTLPQHSNAVEPPTEARQELVETTAEMDEWDRVTVRSGQTLDAIFRQQGFEVALLHRILKLNEDTKGLTRINPGDMFEFKRDDKGELLEMRFPAGEDRYLLVRQVDGEVFADSLPRQIYSEIVEAQGVISSSLFLAGKEAGLSDAKVMDLANIFGWDIDFVQDIREGDRFVLVYERVFRDGEFLRDGQILAATFINQGERFQAIWFDNGDIAEYFAPDGRNMKKAFLRAPLNFSYISSGFNPKRMHPVLKRIRPHNGIDYYAPKGTPVYAAGAGTVIKAGYSAANGNHIFIKHANGIETKYLHFSKNAVKLGAKVKQGQTIGYVGSTGLATGPHLHYEFLVNGVHRNPRTVPLPKVEPLQGTALLSFQQKAAPMLTQLSRLESASLYASRE
jgi:murein DD-endopeptidase MepM/ murein hydrolase activator NlpD